MFCSKDKRVDHLADGLFVARVGCFSRSSARIVQVFRAICCIGWFHHRWRAVPCVGRWAVFFRTPGVFWVEEVMLLFLLDRHAIPHPQLWPLSGFVTTACVHCVPYF